jgi:SAM-dependent methyltransferase
VSRTIGQTQPVPEFGDRPGEEITTGHPSAHLRAAPSPGDEPPPSLSAAFPAEADLPPDVVCYGPDIADESSLRLIGNVDAKRVLELGGGAGQNAVALARQGAHVIVVDPSHRRIERIRARCDDEHVRVELHQSDLAELAFVRAETIDVVVSVFSMGSVADLDRVFRQVHRVLRRDGTFVFSIPHPAFVLTQGGSYFDELPRAWEGDDASGEERPRTISDIFTGLMRANFRVDTLLEPEPVAAPRSRFWVDAMSRAPATLIVRGRKEGL